MIVEAEAGEFGYAELFRAECARRNRDGRPNRRPRVSTPLHAVDERRFRGFEELLRPGEKSFAGADELEFIAQRFFRGRAGEFGGLEFAGREID